MEKNKKVYIYICIVNLLICFIKKIVRNLLCFIIIVGAKNLSLCVGFKVSFFNNNVSEKKKVWGKAP